MMDTALLVPMSVEALVVPDGPAKAVNLAARFNLLQRGWRLGRVLRAEPWDQQIDLPAGVHLHWALPAALAHGIQARNGIIEFPPVPNRWLVLRVAADAAAARSTKAWVVRSDEVGDHGANDFLIKRGDSYVATRIGRAYRYDEPWDDETGAAFVDVLTAIGPGTPIFAAFYPGCRNVFGFHDDLAEVDRGTFLYLVAGWYARREGDPLNPDNKLARGAAFLKDLEEQWLAGSAIAKPYPTQTVCHGTVQGIEWQRHAPQPVPPAARYTVAVGSTSAEALAARLAAPVAHGAVWEPLLAAFQYDALANLDRTHGSAEIDAELHRRRFQQIDGGTQWIVKPIETVAGTGAHSKPPFPGQDPDIAELFNTLDDTQRASDQLARELAALRAEYFAAWCRRELPFSREGALLADRLATLRRSIADRGTQALAREQAVRDLCGRLQAKGIRIPPGAGQGAPPQRPEYELVAVPMPWFWRPLDPAILLSAPGEEEHRYQRGGRRTALRGGAPPTASPAPRSSGVVCRTVEQVLRNLKITIETKTAPEEVTVAMPEWALPLARQTRTSMPFDAIDALLQESLLLDPARAQAIAEKAYAQIGLKQAQGSILTGALAKRIAIVQRDRQAIEDVQAGGNLPGWAVATWQPKADPLFLLWEVDWAPAYDKGDIGHLGLTDRWTLADNMEYRWRGTDTDRKPARSYRGWAPLSLSLARQLRERLEAARGDIARSFENWSTLTQAIAGFTDALIMREETLQLPPLNKDGSVDCETLLLLGGRTQWSPLGPDPGNRAGFFPIRAGHVRINRLWLVDAFGQVQKVIDPDPRVGKRPVITAEPLRPPGGASDGWITLPPRIAQPARLLCQWLSVADEMKKLRRETNANPATSPILGWILPNHFARSLLIHDAAGRLRGELQRTDAGLTWSAAPGSAADVQAAEALADVPHLWLFVKGLEDAGSRALEGLLEMVDRISLCITTAAAAQVPSLAVLLGQPLALARASLALEVWGRAATDQSATDAAAETTGGIAAVRFPVRLGDVRQSADGLIGYFVGNDYSRIRPAFGAPPPTKPDTYLAFDKDLEVGLAGNIDVTLLMDPRTAVHVSSGILPAARLELPGQLVSAVLEDIELSSRVGPVLGGADGLRLPVPKDMAGTWAWIDRDRDRQQPWQVNADVSKPDSGTGIPSRPLRICEGWLTFKRAEPAKKSEPSPANGSRRHGSR